LYGIGNLSKKTKRKDEVSRLERKRLEKEDLDKQLAHIKGRHERQKQHYRLAMEGYRTEMKQMHAQITQMKKAMAGSN